MEIFISTAGSKEHHGDHPAEATAILFQIFMVFVRVYIHDSKEYEEELAKLLPMFIEYADKVKKVRGVESTRKLLHVMYEDACRSIPVSIKAVHRNPAYAHLKKSVGIDDTRRHSSVQKSVVDFGEEFINHVLEGKQENVGRVIASLHRLARA